MRNIPQRSGTPPSGKNERTGASQFRFARHVRRACRPKPPRTAPLLLPCALPVALFPWAKNKQQLNRPPPPPSPAAAAAPGAGRRHRLPRPPQRPGPAAAAAAFRGRRGARGPSAAAAAFRGRRGARGGPPVPPYEPAAFRCVDPGPAMAAAFRAAP